MSGIVSKSYLEDVYSKTKPQIATKSDVIRCWIENHVPVAEEKQQKTAIEIGCYAALPGGVDKVLDKATKNSHRHWLLPRTLPGCTW
jgi:hypothetical protein